MNKPYTCHNCGTVFDALPAEDVLELEQPGNALVTRIKVVCPGCYDNGITDLAQRTYVLDVTGDAALES